MFVVKSATKINIFFESTKFVPQKNVQIIYFSRFQQKRLRCFFRLSLILFYDTFIGITESCQLLL